MVGDVERLHQGLRTAFERVSGPVDGAEWREHGALGFDDVATYLVLSRPGDRAPTCVPGVAGRSADVRHRPSRERDGEKEGRWRT